MYHGMHIILIYVWFGPKTIAKFNKKKQFWLHAWYEYVIEKKTTYSLYIIIEH